LILGLLTARTSHRAVICFRSGELQQLGEGGRTGLMHGGADRGFDGFQIQVAGFALAGKQGLQ
jgi:hypothetical protein